MLGAPALEGSLAMNVVPAAGSAATEPTPNAAAGPSSFLAPIREDLSAVEEILKAQIRSDVRAAYAISGHTLSAGGKRLRSAPMSADCLLMLLLPTIQPTPFGPAPPLPSLSIWRL